MENVTPLEQKCRVKNRKMTDIIRNIDTIETGYIVLIDQQKRFDRVNHTYLLAT